MAALAYGTATIAPVDKIVGPGNAYVAEAKRQVFGRVGIDLIAGPSEILIVAQAVVDPDWVAADLLSQAEHDERAQAILITDDRGFAERVMAAVEAQLLRLDRGGIAAASWRAHGAVVVVGRIEDAADLVDALAPEHLELIGPGAEALAPGSGMPARSSSGRSRPRSSATMSAGPPHVLPTARTARFASGLAVHDFLKRTTLLGCDPASFAGSARPPPPWPGRRGSAHARAVERRLDAMRERVQASDRGAGARPEEHVRWSPQVEHERSVAIFDLLEGNHFKLVDGAKGPYSVVLSLRESSIVLAVSPEASGEPVEVVLTTRAFRRVIKDYFMICDSYFQAIKGATPSRIESIDMARRACTTRA